MRDFQSFKALYTQKISQQEQLTKQLRRQQKELKETAGVMTNQKSSFRDLQRLLNAKLAIANGESVSGFDSSGMPGGAAPGKGYGQAHEVMSIAYGGGGGSESMAF